MTQFGIYLYQLLNILQWLIVIRAISSWIFMRNPGSPIYQLLVRITEPIVGPVRSLLAPLMGRTMFDFSVLGSYLIIEILKYLLRQSLF
ncbi:MAG TPA: YggT family protein [Tissierellia bacterium]|jgi:YggT family protein|nr:YggT family protein [Tissierellia bacterium]